MRSWFFLFREDFHSPRTSRHPFQLFTIAPDLIFRFLQLKNTGETNVTDDERALDL